MTDPQNPGITVIIATYNRAAILRETLERMAAVERDGLSVQWVLVDNNSIDDTKKVILSYADRLPLIYLFEARSGKNCALNRALREATLGDIVVFTDDDIFPGKGWFRQILAACEQWRNFDIFGGKIDVIWPAGKELRISDKVKTVCFGQHDFGNAPRVYPKDWHPFGGNFWVRKRLFEGGCMFDESMGPRPRNRISGGESSLLMKLEKQGHGMLYHPGAVVGHRIEARETSFLAMLKRGYRSGRGYAHIDGIKDAALHQRAPRAWLLRQMLKLCYDAARIIAGPCVWPQKARISFNYDTMANLGWILESFRVLRHWRQAEARRTRDMDFTELSPVAARAGDRVASHK